MSLGFTSLIAEVQSYFGAVASDDLYGDVRVGRIINNAIRSIIRNHKGFYDVGALDKTTLTSVGGQYSYGLAAVATAKSCLEVGAIHRVKFVNTTANSYHTLKPYIGGLDAWDTNFPWLETWGQTTYAITACSHTANPPSGDTITVAEDLSGFTTNYKITGKEIWVDFDRIPTDITSSDTPLLTDADEIIINRAVGECMLRNKNMGSQAREYIAISEGMILERLEGEIDNDQADTLWDRGP
jgi:hypothetical protein